MYVITLREKRIANKKESGYPRKKKRKKKEQKNMTTNSPYVY